MIASWRVALRLARREALRHRLRSALTAALVGMPVAALVVLAVLVASARISTTEQAHRNFGQANLVVSYNGPTGTYPPALARLLPPGSTVAATSNGQGLVRRTGKTGRAPQVSTIGVDSNLPLTQDILHLRSGRFALRAGEATISPSLAAQLGVRISEDVDLFAMPGNPGATTRVRIVGLAVTPENRNGFTLAALPSTLQSLQQSTETIAAVPPATDFIGLHKYLGARGFTAFQPLDFTRSGGTSEAVPVSVGVLVVGLALLIAALTSGSAFAVGARRQRRTLALVAVNGGHQPQLSRVVLASGLLLGVVGTVAALPVGLLLSWAGYPILQAHVSRDLPGLRVHVTWVVGALVFGVVSALLAAAIPARLAARTPLSESLGAARGATSTPHWVTALGAALAVVGVLVTLLGATSSQLVGHDRTPWILLGAGLVQLGGVAICPVLIGAAGKLGRFVPATGRLALRDAARQRGRSGPAIAAVAAAVSGAMAVSVYAGSIDLRDRRQYDPPTPAGIVTLYPLGPPTALDASQRASALQGLPVAYQAPFLQFGQIGSADVPVNNRDYQRYGAGLVEVGDASTIAVLTGRPQPAAAAALAAGKAVVPTAGLTRDGAVPIQAGDTTSDDGNTIPAFVLPWATGSSMPSAVISAQTAQSLHLTVQNAGPWQVRLSRSVPRADLALLTRDDAGLGVALSYDTGYTSTLGGPLKALLTLSALFSLLVTGSAAALASTDSRGDLATLGAVGASPGVRRRLAAAQAGTTALLGGGLGILIGLVPAYAVVIARSDVLPFTVPWQPFPIFLIGLPAVAALGGLLFTRSRLPRPARIR